LSIAGFLVLAIAAHAFDVFALWPAITVAGAGAVLNALNHLCVRQGRWVGLISAVAVPMDHVFTTFLVVCTGGMHSPFVVLYVVAVLATAMLVDTLVAAASGIFALLLWGSVMWLQQHGLLQFTEVATQQAAFTVIWGAFLGYCLALLVYLGGYISDRLRFSEADLAERNVRLNAALANLQRAHDDLRAAYERVRQTEGQLLQSEKLRALGQLVAGVAHELNNPISFISGNIEHLRGYVERLAGMLDFYAAAAAGSATDVHLAQPPRGAQIDDTLRDLHSLIDDCEEGSRRIRQIVLELRTFARSDERESWRHSDVRPGIVSTLSLLGHRLKRGITVHPDLQPVPEVECQPGPLNQVFMNLLSNAIDAVGSGPGNIWISTRVPDHSPQQIEIAVRDDGPGIAAELQPRIFEPFFTTKAVGEGTGLGLSVSYGIVQRHHGELSVQSQLGQGTTFTLLLPVKQPPPAVC
jgi:signal transduction histidine kinase